MPLKRIPIPNKDGGQWGTILNAHLSQTVNPENGALNTFDDLSSRPSLLDLTKDDIGLTYLFTQTGNFHELYWDEKDQQLDWKINNELFANVKDHGAVGDGAADDTKAIAYCFKNFKKIYFPTGIYCISSPLFIPANIALLGDGGTLSEIKNICKTEDHFIYSYNGTDNKGIKYNGAFNILIESLYLNGNIRRISGGAKKGSTVEISNLNFQKDPVKNNIILKNCVFAGSGFCTVGSVNAHGVLIDGCRFINGRDSHIGATTGCTEWTVINNSFDETVINSISFSNNGISGADYAIVGQVRNMLVSNNRVSVGANVDMENKTVAGIGIELDGCRDTIISNNIITITQGGAYGIKLIPSFALKNIYDCNDIIITGNTIINLSPNTVSGIECMNNSEAADHQAKHLKISNNIIRNEIASSPVGKGLTGIAVYNINKVIIENNVIKSVGQLLQGILLNVFIPGAEMNTDIIGNDISGATLAGIQCSGTSTKKPKAILINNRVYNNTTNLGFGHGWEFTMQNNYTPAPNYLDLNVADIHGDLKCYIKPPTQGNWLKGEIVYNSSPVASITDNPRIVNYIGWVCISGGTPGKWKGFGLISE